MNNKIIAIIVILLIVFALGAIVFISGSKNQQKDTDRSLSQEADFQIGKINNVVVTEIGFEPSTLNIKVNDLVTWINDSGTAVTVNSSNHPTHTLNKLLNLGQFENSSTVQAFFEEPGTYSYHNHLKPEQRGTIIVE